MSKYWFVIGDVDLEVALINLHRGHIIGMIRSSLPLQDGITAAVIEFAQAWEEEDLELDLPDAQYVEITCRCKAEVALAVVLSMEDVKEEGDILKLRAPWLFGDFCRIEDDDEYMEHNFEL